MTGIFLLFVIGAWVALLALLARALTRRIKDAISRLVVSAIIIGLLLPLPVVDELLGKSQFEQLCRENSAINVDREKAVGKTVYLASATSVGIKGTWLPIVMQQWRFVDFDTRELVVSYNTLKVGGGRLAHALPVGEGYTPFTFPTHTCRPKDAPGSDSAFEALGIKYVEPPKTK